MTLYDRDRHEMFVLKWWTDLNANPAELENLFAKPLRNLTTILNWAASTVKVMFETDWDGIWAAAWVEPYMSGAFFGAWIRPDKRHTKAALQFINQAYDTALGYFPVLIGLTKQKNLHELHLRLGYEYVGEVPYLFDGQTAYEYRMTKESRAFALSPEGKEDGRRRRQNEHQQRSEQQPLRGPTGAIRQVVPAGSSGAGRPAGGSAENGRGKRADSDHKPKRRRRAPSPVESVGGNAGVTSPQRP